jgi:uncharacterized membrane-anchored protein
MMASDVRNWLGIYVLILVGVLGGYCFLAPASLLPLETGDRVAAFEIILPLLIAQLSVIYRFYTDHSEDQGQDFKSVPSWAVKAPLIIVSCLLLVEFVLFGVAGMTRVRPPSAETFKGLVTFCVALLNASTVLMITKYFHSRSSVSPSQPSETQKESLEQE